MGLFNYLRGLISPEKATTLNNGITPKTPEEQKEIEQYRSQRKELLPPPRNKKRENNKK